MADLLAARMPGRTLMVVNDANCAALAESTSGSATGIADVLLVTLGTGIGGGLVADSRVLVGARGFAGEIGHQVVDPSGPRCPCGRRGCWERYTSGAGLVHLARRAARAGALGSLVAHTGGDPEAVRGEDVTAAARAGDPQALVVMDELAWWVALGLANLVAVLDPSTIVLGGGLVEFADLWLGPTKEAFTDMVEGGPDRPHIEIVAAAWGERAGAVGAALAVRRGWR